MKILHYAPTLQPGGATQLASDLAYALQLFEVQSFLVAPAESLAGQPASSQLRLIPYHPFPVPGDWGHTWKLRSLIIERKPEIVQAYGFGAIATAAKALRLLPANRRPKLVGALTGYASGAAALHTSGLSACDAITVISKHLRQHLKKSNPDMAKSWVIPYGVNETLCNLAYRSPAGWQEAWQAKHPECKERFVVCVPGPISEAHGTADIVPIVTTLMQQDIPVQILLAANPKAVDVSFMTLLRRRIRAAGIDAQVSWESDTTRLRDIMCSCDAVIDLALSPEAYNRPILEALALGRPVAGYEHGVSGEYLEAFQPIGIVPVGDFDAIADVLSQWHTYPPDPAESIPYPYRLSDTAKSYHDLYTSLS